MNYSQGDNFFVNGEVARIAGVNAAILFDKIAGWIEHNAVNSRNCRDGRYWTFNSRKAWKELVPFMSDKQVRTALDKLVEADLIRTEKLSPDPMDRTLWYAIGDAGEELIKIANAFAGRGKCHLPEGANVSISTSLHINNNLTEENNKSSLRSDVVKENPKTARFVKPSIDEIRAFCEEKGYQIDAERFWAHYESNGWKVGGKAAMKSWHAAIVTWVKNAEDKAKESSQPLPRRHQGNLGRDYNPHNDFSDVKATKYEI